MLPVHRDGFNRRRNEEIWIGVAVSVGVGGEVIWIEKIPDLKVLGDGFSVISSNTGGKILGSFDSSRCGFDGKSRN